MDATKYVLNNKLDEIIDWVFAGFKAYDFEQFRHSIKKPICQVIDSHSVADFTEGEELLIQTVNSHFISWPYVEKEFYKKFPDILENIEPYTKNFKDIGCSFGNKDLASFVKKFRPSLKFNKSSTKEKLTEILENNLNEQEKLEIIREAEKIREKFWSYRRNAHWAKHLSGLLISAIWNKSSAFKAFYHAFIEKRDWLPIIYLALEPCNNSCCKDKFEGLVIKKKEDKYWLENSPPHNVFQCNCKLIALNKMFMKHHYLDFYNSHIEEIEAAHRNNKEKETL